MAPAAWNGNCRRAAPTLPAADQRAGSRRASDSAAPCPRGSNGLAAAGDVEVDGGVGVGAWSAGYELQAEGAAELDLRDKRRV